MTLPEVGDRIELLAMPEDPCPIEPGTKGTVRQITDVFGQFHQISVDWDVERSLLLCVPPDTFRIIGKEETRS